MGQCKVMLGRPLMCQCSTMRSAAGTVSGCMASLLLLSVVQPSLSFWLTGDLWASAG